jgi:hypothetical protein
MGGLQKRGNYTPRRVREKRAYQLVVVGSITGVLGVVGVLLAVAGVMSATWPLASIVIAVVCALMLRRLVHPPR